MRGLKNALVTPFLSLLYRYQTNLLQSNRAIAVLGRFRGSVDPAVDLFTHFPSLVSCLRSSGGHFDISYLLLSRLVVVPPATRQRKVKVERVYNAPPI